MQDQPLHTTDTMAKSKTPKLTLYVLATAVPLVLLVFVFSTYLYNINSRYHAFDHKIDGVHALSVLHKAITALQKIRGRSQLEAFQKKTLHHDEHGLLKTFLSLTTPDSLGAYASDKVLIEVRTQLEQIHKLRPAPETAASMFQQYSSMIDALHTHLEKIARQSGLLLETKHDTYYLMEVFVRDLPELAETVGQVRGISGRITARGTWHEQESSQIKRRHILLQHQLKRIIDAARIIHGNNETLGIQLKETINRLETALQGYLANTEKIFSSGGDRIQSVDLFNQGTKYIDTINDLLSGYASFLEQALVSEQMEIRQTLISSAIAILLALLVTAYYIIRFYQGNKDNLAELRRYKTTLDLTHDCVFMFDPVLLKFIYANQGACDLIGYTAAELLNMTLADISPEYDVAGIYKMVHPLIRDGGGNRIETIYKHKNGTEIDVEISIQYIKPENEIPRFVAIARDVTERKQLEEILQSADAVLNNVIDGIITIRDDGIVKTFNPAAEKIFGYRPDEVIGHNINMLMPSPYHEKHDGYLHNYISTGDAKIIGIGREVEGKRKDGSTFPMDLAVSEMWVGDKRMFTGIVRDITERKKIDRMKNEFISTVSHELRTPLTSIRGSIGLLLGGAVGNLSGQVTELLTIAGNNTERLLLLINDILDIQKIESGNMSFRYEYLDVMPFVKRAIIDNQGYATQHNVTFRIASDIGEGKILADPDRLMQVINNLLSNAAKFSPANDTVDIAVARHHDAIRISVTDYGPGIPEDFQPKLFDKFTQSDSTDSRKRGGTGLGLNIAKIITEKHGGRIGFVTQKNIGTTMFIELPEMIGVQDKQLTHIELQPPTLQDGHRPCILIIEDDPDVAALVRRILAEGGFNSDIAYNAAEAIELLTQKSHQYQAITLDILLPDKDGMTLLSELRDNPDIPDIPVVVVSIEADEARRDINGSAIGVTDWLQKPIDEGRLLEAVRNTAATGMTPRILHVEDEIDVHKVVSMMLKDKAELVWSQTFAKSCELLETEHFDLVLLDIGLPDQSGLDLIPIIQQKENPPRVIIFSARDVPEDYLGQVHAVLTKSRTTNLNLVNTIKSLLPHGSI